MRFMMIYKPADIQAMEAGTPPSKEHMEAMGEFIGEMARSGKLLQTDGLLPSSMGARVRLEKGEVTIKDGPFTESKELVAGYAIMQLASMEEAKALAQRFLKVAGDGESEIRQMYDAPAYVAESIHEVRVPLA